MKVTIIILTCLFLAAAISGQNRNVVSDRDEALLLLKQGTVTTGTSVLYTLKTGDHAALSPRGNCFSVLSAKKTEFGVKKTVRVYARTGNSKYEIPGTGADMVHVADNGASVLVTVLGMDVNAKTRLEFYNPSGIKTGSVITSFPGECKFFPGDAAVAVSIKGESTRVFHMESGRELYRVPYARTHIPLKDNKILLVDRAWFAFFDGGKETWRRSHNLYHPRLVTANANGTKVLVGCHHEVAVVDTGNGIILKKWDAPASFGVISIDASSDFTTIAVGVRSLQGIEAVCLLDQDLKLLEKQEQRVSKPTAYFPQVAVLEKPELKVMVLGQSWEKTLKREMK
jgi:hypothetical protein